jgi:hypothetical protein
MKQTIFWRGWLLLLLVTFFLFPAALLQAQSSTPNIQELLIELWPEYDRPEVLVIHRIRLNPDTPLPTQVSFRLPDYIEEMHAVAVEEDGILVDVNPETIEIRQEGDSSLLTFTTLSPNIQLEYYDPVILTREEQTRQLTYEFTASYPIETVTFELQEPFQATNFSMTPEPSNSFIGTNGLKYNNLVMTGMEAGETISLSATYRRVIDTVSVEGLASVPEGLSGNTNQVVDLDNAGGGVLADSSGSSLAYILIGAGVGLLLATGGYWWWSTRVRAEAGVHRPVEHQTTRRPGYRRKQAAGKGPALQMAGETESEPPRSPAPGGYCHRCGAVLRADANFCHICGTERRQS